MSGVIIKQARIYPKDCRLHSDRLFVFGDNMARRGTAGQAVIRGEINAVGIPTKHLPATFERAYFTDADFVSPWASGSPTIVRRAIDDAFDKLCQHIESGGIVVIPSDGVGTGLAELPTRAPAIHRYICARLGLLASPTRSPEALP